MIFLLRFLIGLAFGRRLICASQIIDDPRVTPRLARTHALATSSPAESELISVPVTMGALRPTILLPADWRDWDDAKLDAVLAHELSHVARRDPLTQRLSLLHRAIFWFSPLAWLLDRHLADLAEQASDEAALSCGTDRKHYARILLDFSKPCTPRPDASGGKASPWPRQVRLKKELNEFSPGKDLSPCVLKKSIAVVVVALAIPVVYLAASAHPAQHVPCGAHPHRIRLLNRPTNRPRHAPAPPPDSCESTPARTLHPPARSPLTRPTHGVDSGGPTPPPPRPCASALGVARSAFADHAPIAPMRTDRSHEPPSPKSLPSRPNRPHDHGFSYHYGYDDDQRFVIVTGKSDSLTMSGSTADARHVEKLRKSIPGDFIWFQGDEKSYIIRDQATVDRARKLWAPQEELGKKQEELGKQQEALGKQQEALGARMEKVRVNVPDMTAQLDKLKAELKALGSSATMDQIGKIQAEMASCREDRRIQSHAGDQQGKLGEEMGALGEKQGKLGEQQGELGRQQAELAEKASKEMKLLLEEAVKKGIAQPEL